MKSKEKYPLTPTTAKLIDAYATATSNVALYEERGVNQKEHDRLKLKLIQAEVALRKHLFRLEGQRRELRKLYQSGRVSVGW